MSKNPLKFFIRGLLIIAIGFGAVYAIQFWRQRTNPEYQVLQYFKDLERQYREDPYGGSTPEETLQLFIDALKKGDIELAAKYFIIDGQKERREYLEKVKRAGNWKLLVNELSRVNYSKKDFNGLGEIFVFNFYNTEDNTSMTLNIGKLPNGIWKILDW